MPISGCHRHWLDGMRDIDWVRSLEGYKYKCKKRQKYRKYCKYVMWIHVNTQLWLSEWKLGLAPFWQIWSVRQLKESFILYQFPKFQHLEQDLSAVQNLIYQRQFLLLCEPSIKCKWDNWGEYNLLETIINWSEIKWEFFSSNKRKNLSLLSPWYMALPSLANTSIYLTRNLQKDKKKNR